MVLLGVNVDHVATVRQARRSTEPDPVWAAAMAELGGADQITVHLREDRRHIQDRDVEILIQTVNVKLNLECACTDEMISNACRLGPHQVCLVPEKREEVTTEGGLNVRDNRDLVRESVNRLRDAGIFVSLFIDPDPSQITASRDVGADAVELHTGTYANCKTAADQKQQLGLLEDAGKLVQQHEMRLDAGHGLNYTNVVPVATIAGMAELNIGHSIISRSMFVGMQTAVREMKQLVTQHNVQ